MTETLEITLNSLTQVTRAAKLLRCQYGDNTEAQAQQFQKEAEALQREADAIFWSDVLDALIIEKDEQPNLR